jgi:hypothetical protein
LCFNSGGIEVLAIICPREEHHPGIRRKHQLMREI